MLRTELAHKLRRNAEGVTLSFHNPMHEQWIYGIYGSEEIVSKRLPMLAASWKATTEKPHKDEMDGGGFVDDNGINVVNWHRENNTLIIEATTSLTEAAIFIDEHLEVRTAAGEIVAGFTQSTLGANHTTFVVKTDFDPKTFQSDILEIDFTSNWAVASTGLLKASMHSRDIHTRALVSSTVKAVHILHPVKKTPSNPLPINICYNRVPVPKEDIDYVYGEQFDPTTGLQRLYAPLSAWVEFTDNNDEFLDIDMSTFALKMDCQNGIAKYTKTGRETLIQKHFCKGPDKSAAYANGFFFELDPNWMENVPSARLPKRDRIDIFFSVEYICTSGARGNIQISSTASGAPTANIAQAGWMNILWGCLVKGTNILMADQTTRPIEELRIGDYVAGENGHPIEVENIITGIEYEPLVVLHTAAQNKLACSSEHPVMTTKGMVKACDLNGESVLYGENGEELQLDGIWNEKGEYQVYNLCVSGGRFYAEGILVGDFIVQGELGSVKQVLCITEESPVYAEREAKYEIWRELE